MNNIKFGKLLVAFIVCLGLLLILNGCVATPGDLLDMQTGFRAAILEEMGDLRSDFEKAVEGGEGARDALENSFTSSMSDLEDKTLAILESKVEEIGGRADAALAAGEGVVSTPLGAAGLTLASLISVFLTDKLRDRRRRLRGEVFGGPPSTPTAT